MLAGPADVPSCTLDDGSYSTGDAVCDPLFYGVAVCFRPRGPRLDAGAAMTHDPGAAEDVGSLTVAILREIRDGVLETNARVDSLRSELSARVDATNERLDRIEHRQTETDVRLSTELLALHEAVLELAHAVSADRDVRVRVEQHDARIGALERKVG